MNIQKPTLVQVIAWTTLASGIVNLIWGVAASGTALATIVGIVCIPITILPTLLGAFELIYAAKLFSNPPQAFKPSTSLAILEIACVLAGNVFSMAVGILSLIFYNDTEVKDYFSRLNGIVAPVAVMPSIPASIPDVKPAPAAEQLPQPPAKPPVPPEPDPEKPKRVPRKIAKK